MHKFKAPYDKRFRDYMLNTVEHLMNSGFDITYGYTQSDEISLLFSLEDETVFTTRRRIKRELDLPMKDDYSQFITELFSS